ncbi:nicotinamide riboside transporter PnuC [Kitasatospora sp. NPDC088391]|uniref:nicotinamide riboside transporter PnuC n=1 Tax=Kitasatospora sp. NPDC088391 TaxID=3364074 RepID=UPI0038303A3C
MRGGTTAEWLGFVTGAVCVWLTVRTNVWNFPVGIADNAFFLVIFAGAGLYADSGLQVVFLALGAHGWWRWLRRGERGDRLAVRRGGPAVLGAALAAVAVATAGLYLLLAAVGDSAPFADALTTALSLAAQWLLNTKRIETWYLWIAADLVYVPLYLARGLYPTAAVYCLFLGLCCYGLRSWRAELPTAGRPLEAAA